MLGSIGKLSGRIRAVCESVVLKKRRLRWETFTEKVNGVKVLSF